MVDCYPNMICYIEIPSIISVGAAIIKLSAIKRKLNNQIDKTCDKTVTQAGNMSMYRHLCFFGDFKSVILKLGRKLQHDLRNYASLSLYALMYLQQVLLGVY
ncbi:hypothetical protein ACFE04_009677 [Oxalis oulophora]